MALRTVLHDWHVAHGARMVDFAGWDMPVQYTSIVEEHTAVRSAAGLFDISHMGRLSFGGDGALPLIQRIFTNNAATMKDMQVRYGLVCNDQGGIRDDVLVYRWPYGWAMVVNASNREKIVAWINESKASFDVQMQDQTLETCMVAVQGPKAIELCRGITEADAGDLGYYFATPSRYRGQPCVVSRTGYTGEDGLEIMVGNTLGVALWEELIARGIKPCGLGARDTLRLEAAMPLYGHELSEEIDPFQAGLAWAVKLDKGEFRGRDALRKLRDDPTRRQRVGLALQGKRIAREGAKVLADGKEIGIVSSGTFGPTLNKSIAMAYVDPNHRAVGSECVIDIRGKQEAAKVVALPFYKRES
ncbi:MAG: glycine cleavage system aminomethyltransferase GcvT [Planctomycetes bacterium]|nr:glycine cleavage system aminomethyltransferase GcvT [Planctomycetota bacterium]